MMKSKTRWSHRYRFPAASVFGSNCGAYTGKVTFALSPTVPVKG